MEGPSGFRGTEAKRGGLGYQKKGLREQAWGASLPMATQTAMASAAGSLWRIAITPIDTFKTTLQVRR